MFDWRVEGFIGVNAYLFNVQFDDGLTTEFQVNPEFGSVEASRVEAERFGRIFGQLPTLLRTRIDTVWIHKGEGGGALDNKILIQVDDIAYDEESKSFVFVEEVLVHEGAHTSLDPIHAEDPDWIAAQAADSNFISNYARDFPKREDMAESFLPYLAIRYFTNRISRNYEQTVLETIPNRIEYFDRLIENSDMHPLIEDLRVDDVLEPFEWPPGLVACSQNVSTDVGDEWVDLEPYFRNQLPHFLPLTVGQETEIIFVNNSTIEVLFYWLDYDLSEKYFGRIAPCNSTTHGTFAGHIWIAKDQHGNNLAMFKAESNTGRAFIGPQAAPDTVENEQGLASAQLAKVSGDEQQGLAGAALPEPFLIEVRDQNGNPLAGVQVTFAVTAGEGTMSATTATTGADGRAAAALTLSPIPGTNTVRATVAGLEPVTFAATGLAVPRTLDKLSGDEQQAGASALLAEPFLVSVLDQNGAALPGAVVTFAILGDGGTLSAASDTTDAEGLAATTLTLGEELGTYSVVATVADLEPVTFTATAIATPDFDGDGVTGFSDFFLFADAFGGSDPHFDLDGSGSVDYADFFLLADYFADPARGKLLALAGEMIGLSDGPQLQQNAPNPFNSETVISWFLLRPGPARMEVFTLTGQRVAVLHQGQKKAGVHRVHWDGRDDDGRSLASGVYLYRLITNESLQTRKLTLLR